MKVIKKVDTSGWNIKHTCTTCESELEIEKGDIKYEYHSGYQRDPDYVSWTTKCPVCNQHIDISIKSIPKVVQVEIKNGKIPSPGVSYVDQFEDERGKLPRDER